MKKRLPLALGLVLAMSGTAFAAYFPDTAGHWAEKNIDWVAARSYIEGYKDGTFRPDNSITRAEFYTMVNRYANFTATVTTHFSDVKNGDWYADAVARAVAAGYIKDSTGALSPDSAMDRDEAARIIATIHNLPKNPNPTSGFSDAAAIINKAEVGSLIANNILNGYPDGTFKPKGTITRAEFAKILETAKERLGDVKKKEVVRDNKALLDAMNRADVALRSYRGTVDQRRELELARSEAQSNLGKTLSTYEESRITSRIDRAIDALNGRINEVHVIFVDRGRRYTDTYVKPGQGAQVSLDPWRSDARFLGWSLYERGPILNPARESFYRDTTLYAVWEESLGTYRIDVTGGIASKSRANAGELVTISPRTISGKRFTHWTTEGITLRDDTIGEQSFFMPARSISLVAHYTDVGTTTDPGTTTPTNPGTTTPTNPGKQPEETYHVDVTGGTADKKYAKPGETVHIKLGKVPEGKKFIGWSGSVLFENEKAEETRFTVPDKPADLYIQARYEDTNLKKYKLTLLRGITSFTEVPAGRRVVVNTAPEDLYRFKEWVVPEDIIFEGKTQPYGYFTMPNHDVTLTYTLKEVYTLSLIVDGHEYSRSQYLEGDKLPKFREPQHSDKTFKGWSLSENGDVVDFDQLEINKNMTFYAIWQ